MARAWARGDVDEVCGFQHFDPIPHAPRHNERTFRPNLMTCLGTNSTQVAIVQHHLDPPRDQVEERRGLAG